MKALRGGELLAENSIRMMNHYKHLNGKGEKATADQQGYGMGIMRIPRDGFTLVGHGGMFNGFTAGLWYVPEHELTIAFVLNRGLIEKFVVPDHLVRGLSARE